MTQSPPFPLLKHPAFQDLSDAALSRLQGSTKLLRFELGQQLCEPDDIPARILVLLKGQARLVGRHNGRLTTVGKFGPGSVIGAASLLCGSACENVIASDEVIACAISDEEWTQLYGEEESFRLWCDEQLWPQELLALLEVLEEGTAETESSALEQLEQMLKTAKRCRPDAEAIDAALATGGRLHLTSCWGDATVGQPIRAVTDLPSTGRFGPRLVLVPGLSLIHI